MLYLLIIVAILIAVLLILAAKRPDRFQITRATTIKASPEKIFPLINDFHQWNGWSPWAKIDPSMKQSFSGAANGKGAVYEWEGNKKVGRGRMEIIDSSAPSRIDIKLDFYSPFEAHNTTEFLLKENGGVTGLTWTMQGPSNYVSKLMGLFFNMDKLVGKDFEAGLASLKRLAENNRQSMNDSE